MLHEGLFGDEKRTCFLLAALEMAGETVTGAAGGVRSSLRARIHGFNGIMEKNHIN